MTASRFSVSKAASSCLPVTSSTSTPNPSPTPAMQARKVTRAMMIMSISTITNSLKNHRYMAVTSRWLISPSRMVWPY